MDGVENGIGRGGREGGSDGDGGNESEDDVDDDDTRQSVVLNCYMNRTFIHGDCY